MDVILIILNTTPDPAVVGDVAVADFGLELHCSSRGAHFAGALHDPLQSQITDVDVNPGLADYAQKTRPGITVGAVAGHETIQVRPGRRVGFQREAPVGAGGRKSMRRSAI